MNITMSLFHPVHKRERMNSLKIIYIQISNDITLSPVNNPRKAKIPLSISSLT